MYQKGKLMEKPEINSEQYTMWCRDQLVRYLNSPLTEEITDDQAEAIEYLQAQGLIGQKK